MAPKQMTLAAEADAGFALHRKATRRDVFLAEMDKVVPWSALCALIEPHYPKAREDGAGRRPIGLERMLRIHFLQQWYALSDPGVEEALYDSEAMRRFVGVDLGREAAPDESTVLQFRHLLERHGLAKQILVEVNRYLAGHGMKLSRGTIVDATIIAAPSSTKNQDKARDPEMHQTKKGNQWYFGMKAHIGADAGTGYVHSMTATSANVNDLNEVTHLVRGDDEVVYADAGYQGIARRPEITGDQHLSRVQWRVAARKGKLASMPAYDRHLESRQASVRAKVEHPFLIVKRDFGFTKTRYRGIAKNLNHLHMLFASANWLMRARAVALAG